MAYDEGLAQILRDDLAGEPGITEKKMFGGLCILLNGNMLCGVHSKGGDGGMFRVGPGHYAEALGIGGVREMSFTGRPMKGFVECDAELFDDEVRRRQILAMALGFTKNLKPK